MNKKLNLLFKMLFFIIISFLFVFCTLRISDEDEGVSPGLIIIQRSSAFSQFSSYNPYPNDDTWPVMTSIIVNPLDTSTTREIKISIGAYDSESGVADVSCKFESPTEQLIGGETGQLFSLSLQYIIASKKWEGTVTFSPDSEHGEWMINNISITDLAGHTTNYYRFSEESTVNYYNGQDEVVSNFPFVTVEVVDTIVSSSSSSEGTTDTTPPVINEISIDPEDTSTTRNITISIDANDDMSGIYSLNLIVESPTEQQLGGGEHPFINVNFAYNTSSMLWEGVAVFPEDAETGDWMINNLYIQDNSGNFRNYDRVTEESDTSYYDRYDEAISPLDYVMIEVVETASSSSSSITSSTQSSVNSSAVSSIASSVSSSAVSSSAVSSSAVSSSAVSSSAVSSSAVSSSAVSSSAVSSSAVSSSAVSSSAVSSSAVSSSAVSSSAVSSSAVSSSAVSSSVVSSSAVSSIASSVCIGHWRFDSTSGTIAYDSSGYNNNGTLINSPSWTTGIINNAVNLDGVNDYIDLPDNMSNLTDFTFITWVYWDSSTYSWQRILDFGASTTKYMFLTPKSSSNTIRFAITTNGSVYEQQLNISGALTTGTWNQIAVTLSGSTGKIYLNGVLKATNTSMSYNPVDLAAARNYLGRSQFSTDPYFDGKIDDARLYNYALSAAEITALYSSGSSSSSSSSSSSVLSSAVSSVVSSTASSAASSIVGNSYLIEAESMSKSGYSNQSNVEASGGVVIRLSSTVGSVTKNFTGVSGYYNITIMYIDQVGGSSTFGFLVDSVSIGTWLGNQTTTYDMFLSKTFYNVYVANGDQLKLTGTENLLEEAKFDCISLVASSGTFSSSSSAYSSVTSSAVSSSASSASSIIWITTSGVYDTNWKVYACEYTPQSSSLEIEPYYRFNSGSAATNTIVNDTSISGNTYLDFRGITDVVQWRYDRIYNPYPTSFTVVFRAKDATPSTSTDGVWDIDLKFCSGRIRIIRSETYVQFNPSTTPLQINSTIPDDDNLWHIWRFTVTFNSSGTVDVTNVWMDETTKVFDNVTSDIVDCDNTVRFGDGSTGDVYNTHYDWIIWRENAVINPGNNLPTDGGLKKLTGSPY